MAIENTHLSLWELDRIFKRARSIFFVGIGGISMSSLAEYCIYHGKKVFGYDRVRGRECLRLEKMAHIRYCSTTDSVRGMDLVVFSNAMSDDTFEIRTARELGIPCVSRANFLAYLMADYKVRIGVSGMHGKSTTCAMLAKIFSYAGYDPTVICGAQIKELGASYRFGKHDYFIFEACEYMNSFLNFSPSDAIVTSVDFDHPDFFDNMAQVRASFSEYILCARRAFINSDDRGSLFLSHPFKITYGIENNADYMAIIDTGAGKSSFEVLHHGKSVAHITLKQFGLHNVYNALCSFAVASENGISPRSIACALGSFDGLERRQELIRHISTDEENEHRVPLFVDYAHHPTEIRASISAFRAMGYEKILCIFQSHTYSRTYALYDDFLHAFDGVGELIVTPIYSAREENTFPISDEGFARDLDAKFMTDYEQISAYVKKSGADLVVIMGAGDIIELKNHIN